MSSPMVEWRNTFSARSSLVQVLEVRRDAYRQRRGAEGAEGRGADPRDARGSRAGAARSLELMRGLLQPAISKEIKEVLDKYYERFFQPAVRNMRDNFALRRSLAGLAEGAEGYDSMLEEQLQLMIQHILEEAKLMYAVEPPRSPPSPHSQSHRRPQRPAPTAASLAPPAAAPATPSPPSTAAPQQPQRLQRVVQTVAQRLPPQPPQPPSPRMPPPPPPQQLMQPPPPPQQQQQQRMQPQPRAHAQLPAMAVTAAPMAPSPPPSPTPTPAVALATLMTGSPGAASQPPATLQQMFKRRKEMDAEAEASRKRARLAAFCAKRQAPSAGSVPAAAEGSPGPRPASPPRAARAPSGSAPGAPMTPPNHPVNYHSPQWDPGRIGADTEFIMGARANKVLGYETSRGRLYTKHPELFKYPSDQEDREWLARNSLIQPTGGKAFVCVLEDVAGLAASQEFRNNPHVNLAELKGFRVPEFMLNKIHDYMSSLRAEPLGEAIERGLAEVSPPPAEQEGVVIVVDGVPLVQLAPQASPSASVSPPASEARLAAPTRAPSSSRAFSASSSPAIILAAPRLPSSAVRAGPASSSQGYAMAPGAMLSTLPPSLETLAPQQQQPVAPPSGAAAAAAAAVAAAAAAAASPGTAAAAADVAVATAGSSMTAMSSAATASSTPASPCGPGPAPRGLLIRSHSMPAGTFVVEPLVLDELELYIKETRSADEDEGNLDLNLEDVHLDVGGEHGQLELAWDFIASMPSPATPGADGLLVDDASADGSTADGASLMADPLVDDVLVGHAATEDVMVVRGLTADVMIGGDTSIVPDDLAMAPDEGGAAGPGQADPALGMEAGALAGVGVGVGAGAGAARHLALAAAGALDSALLDGSSLHASLSMGHDTFSALLSGSVMEDLDIPEGLL